MKKLMVSQAALDAIKGQSRKALSAADAIAHANATQRSALKAAGLPQVAAKLDALRLSGEAAEKVQRALMHLVLYKPFFGALILRLKVAEDREGHPTVWCDGRALRYNSAHIMGQSFDATVASLAHMVAHCALGHPYRRGERDAKLWNAACDQPANWLLANDGELGQPDPMPEARFENMSAEQVYAILESEQPPQPQQQPDEEGESDQQMAKAPGTPMGDVMDAGSSGEPANDSDEDSEGDDDEQESEGKQTQSNAGREASEEDDGEGSGESSEGSEPGDVGDSDDEYDSPEATESEESELKQEEEDWAIAAAAAAVQSEIAGSLSAQASRQVRESLAPAGSYAHYLRMFISAFAKEDQTWSRPSRQSVAGGCYLPALKSESVGKVVVVIDTSGSVSETELGYFEAELRALQSELKPEEIIVLYADAWVNGEQRIPRFEDLRFDREQCKGGGGTDFSPAFERVNAIIEAGENIKGVIYLTDLIGSFPNPLDLYPGIEHSTLWVATTGRRVPFGEVCRIFDR